MTPEQHDALAQHQLTRWGQTSCFGPLNTAELKSAGMLSRVKTLVKHAVRLPFQGPLESHPSLTFVDGFLSTASPEQIRVARIVFAQIGHVALLERSLVHNPDGEAVFDHDLLVTIDGFLSDWQLPAAVRAPLYTFLHKHKVLLPYFQLQIRRNPDFCQQPLDLWCALDTLHREDPNALTSLQSEVSPFFRTADLPAWENHLQHMERCQAETFGTLFPSDPPAGFVDALITVFGHALKMCEERAYGPHRKPHSLVNTIQTLSPKSFFRDDWDILMGLLCGMSFPVFQTLQSDKTSFASLFQNLNNAHDMARFRQRLNALSHEKHKHLLFFVFRNKPTSVFVQDPERRRVLSHPDILSLFSPNARLQASA